MSALTIPVLEAFDQAKPIGVLEINGEWVIRRPLPDFHFALGYRVPAANALRGGGTSIEKWELVCVSAVEDAKFQRTLDGRPENVKQGDPFERFTRATFDLESAQASGNVLAIRKANARLLEARFEARAALP